MADIKGKLKNDLKNMPYIRQFLHEYFDLGKDKDNEAVTVESIRNGVEFKGTNLWILIFAIFIASLGLNVNSTAVVEELSDSDCFQCYYCHFIFLTDSIG